MLVLSWADYSYVMPVTAVGYVLAPLLAHLLLGEVVPGTRWAGAVFIFPGRGRGGAHAAQHDGAELNMRTFLFLAIVVFAGTGGDIAVTHAMKQIGEVKNFSPRALLGVMWRALKSRWIWLGIALMTVAFFSLLALLSWAEVSFVVPATAANYVVGAVGARFLLKERVSQDALGGLAAGGRRSGAGLRGAVESEIGKSKLEIETGNRNSKNVILRGESDLESRAQPRIAGLEVPVARLRVAFEFPFRISAPFRGFHSMCGIVGFTHEDRPAPPGVIRGATSSLIHRGPDQQGVYESPHVSLGAVRLTIIDLVSGEQPMRSEDGDTVLVYNGEVYNYAELRAELEALGHRFFTRSDTEVVLHAFLEWDTECFRRLRGMFAMALWSESRRRLVLARDRVGIKPLYFCRKGRDVYFSSELKGILHHPEIDRNLDLTG